MKKYYIAVNIIGGAEIRAESAEAAHAKAQKMSSKKFTLQPKPVGVWVFEKNHEGIGTGTEGAGTVPPAGAPDVQVREPEQQGGA